MNSNDSQNLGRCVVVVAHPGHELRIYGWLEKLRSTVHVLTDGSGRSGQSRIGSTARIIRQTGCRQGSIFGRFTDLELYEAMLSGDVETFVDLSRSLADSIIGMAADSVIADSAEGEILVHDVCRAVVNAAVRVAVKATGRPIKNFDYRVVGPPESLDEIVSNRLSLDNDCFQRKIDAALSYQEIRDEVDQLFCEYGQESFRFECLNRVSVAKPGGRSSLPEFKEMRKYERHGIQLADQGIYPTALRFQDHVLPVLQSLDAFAINAESVAFNR